MICFRDMAFCNDSAECSNVACSRHWNSDVEKQAVKWWGSEDFPVCFQSFKADCSYFSPIQNMRGAS